MYSTHIKQIAILGGITPCPRVALNYVYIELEMYRAVTSGSVTNEQLGSGANNRYIGTLSTKETLVTSVSHSTTGMETKEEGE